MSAPNLISPTTLSGGTPVGGSGTPNTIPRWTGATTLGDSGLIDNGTAIYTTTRKIAVGSATAVSELTAVTGVVPPTANPPALQTLHGNDQNVFRAKYTSTNFNVSGNWLGLGFGYHANYMKAAIIAEAKDGSGRASMHIALNAAGTSANVDLADARMTVTYDGNVGIGTANPYTRTESVAARTTALNSMAAFATMPLTVTDTTAFATGVGGGINFRGQLTSSSYTNFAAVWGARENAINSDYRGSLVLATADNVLGYPVERARIDSSGNFGIGTASPVAGNRLDVVGGSIRVNEDGAGTATIQLRSNWAGSGAGAIQVQTNNPLAFIVNGAETARINTSGNVGIGTTSPSVRLHVLNNSANALARFESSIANGAFSAWHNGTNTALFAGFGSTLDSAATVDDAVLRYQATKVLIISRGGAEAARFDSSYNFALATANTGATIQAAGLQQGIKLAPSTAASFNTDPNTLDCYEENTWTPTRAGFGGTNPTVTASYTRIGRLVTITVRMVATGGAQYSGTGGTTTLSIPAAITPAANTTASSVMVYGDTTTVGTVTAWNDGFVYLPTFALTTLQTAFSITYRV